MIDVPVIQELYRYNRWANHRMFEAISSLTQAKFTKNLASSHPSVCDTLTHTVWAEWIWLQRWKGTSPQGQTWRYPLWRQMYHVVNHSSYHRGQLTTMLRQLGARPTPTDFLVFHDELESHPG